MTNDKKSTGKTNDSKLQKQIDQLSQDNEKLMKKIADQEQITKRAQSDYLRLKMDMDSLVARTQEQQKTAALEALVQATQKILPFVTQLEQSLNAADPATKDTKRAQGIAMIYKKMLGSLEQLHIQTISANKGDEPDLQAHIPVSTQPTEDKKLKGKIIMQIEQWYQYSNNWVEVVIVPAKVVIWQ